MSLSAALGLDEEPTPDASRWPTPYFAFDEAALRRDYRELASAFAGCDVFYAVKANGAAEVLEALDRCGSGFELASAGELDLLAALEVAPARLVYGSAVKPAEHIARMARYGVTRFACDSPEEARKIAACAPGASIYLRVAVDDRQSVFSMSSKFGVDSEDVIPLARLARALGLEVEGLSLNVGSQASAAGAWVAALSTVASLFEPMRGAGLPVRLLNLGGGYPVSYRDARRPGVSEVAEAVRRAMRALPYQPERVMLEPGRALVARCAALHVSVIARLQRRGVEWLFLDAGAYSALFEALACQGKTQYRVRTGAPAAGDLRSFALAGPTGDGLDVIAHAVLLPERIAIGDELVIEDVGAYSMTMASDFNGFAVPPLRQRRPALSRTISGD